MRKNISLLLTVMLAAAIVTGCGGSDYQTSEPVQVDISEYVNKSDDTAKADTSAESTVQDTAAETDPSVSTSEEPSAEGFEDAGGYESSVVFKGCGFLINEYCVEVDDVKDWYIELFDNNKGKLFMGDNKKSLITEWTDEDGKLTIKAGSSEWSGKSSLKDGVLILDNEEYLLAFFADDADTGEIKIVTEDEYKKLAGVE